MSTNPRRTIIAVPANNGVPLEIDVHTNGAHYAEISECPPAGFAATPFAPQGLNYTLPDDGYTQIYPVLPADVIPFGNKDAMGSPGRGRGLGFTARPSPGQPNIPATPLCKVISATATATQIQLLEWI